MSNWQLTWMLAIGLATLSTGCSGPGPEQDVLRIGMLPKLVGIGYFNATQQGAEEAAAELKIRLTYDGPTEARTEDQIKIIDGWLAQGYDVVAVAPNDPEAISQTLRRATDAGAIVVTWDTDANPEKSGRTTFINQALNDKIGHALVDVMAEGILARGGDLSGPYLIVSGTPTAANQNVWMELMRERIADKYPEMELLEPLMPAEDQQRAQQMTADALNAHTHLKGIWGITSVSLPAAAKAVSDAGKAGQVYVTGLSLPNKMREHVKAGTVEKFILWNPVDLGYLTVHIANRINKGTLVPGITDIGRLKGIEVRQNEVILGEPMLFDAANIDDFDF